MILHEFYNSSFRPEFWRHSIIWGFFGIGGQQERGGGVVIVHGFNGSPNFLPSKYILGNL